MEKNDSTTSKIKRLNYFSLLQEIDNLLNLSADSDNPLNLTEDTSDASTIDTIFNNVAENIGRISNEMIFTKKEVFIAMMFNTVLRICVTNESALIISQTSFKSLLRKLFKLIFNIHFENYDNPLCASAILNSMLTNLAKDGLAEECFKRLLSNEPKPNIADTGVEETVGLVTGDEGSLFILTNDSATTEKESSQYSQIDFPRIVNTYIELVGTFAYTAVIQSPDEFKKNYSSLMISLLNYVDTCLIDKDNHVWLTQPELPSTILSLICNLTDKIALIHMFVDFGYAEKIIQWVRRTDIFAHRIEQIGTLIFIIIHNLSRCKMGLEKLQEEKVFDILMEQRQLVNGRNNSRLSLKFGAALISVATNDELPEENKKLIVDTSRTLYGYCKEAASKDDESKSNELKSEGYHLSELLELLHRAFWNTYIIESILKNETNETPTPMQFFSRLFLSFYGVLLDQEPDDLEKIAAEYLLKILLQISSYPAHQGELVKNKQLCVVIESLAEREELKLYYTQFIWCNLKPQTSPKKPKEERSRMLYVSYDRANEEFCKKFVKDLGDKITIPIWVDYEREKLCDDIQKYSSLQLKTIKSATVIMILVSKAYGDKSTGKCAELCHIISTNRSPDAKKHIIVVNAEANYNFNRSWMINLLRDKTVIHYDDNIGNMTDKVREQIEFSKKLPKKRSFFLSKIARRTTSVSNSSSLRVSSHTQKESSDVAAVSDTVLDDDSTVLIATTRHGSDPVASCLIKQTGTDGSNWV